MLAGDYEHERDIPVRPRILYDRIHEKVEGDGYSRMLAQVLFLLLFLQNKGLYPELSPLRKQPAFCYNHRLPLFHEFYRIGLDNAKIRTGRT